MNLTAIRRLLPLYLGTALTGLSILVSIPVMISVGGLSEWAYIGVGQSVGGVAAAFVSYGWGITGPAEIARLSPRERRREFAESVRARVLVAPLAIAAGAALTWSVTGTQGLLLGLIGLLSTTLIGLSAAYYFLGTGELWKAFLLDSLPRALATFLGVGLVSAPGMKLSVATIPMFTTAGILVASAVSAFAIMGGWRERDGLPRRSILSVLASRRHGLVTSATTGAFQVLPTLVVGWFAPGALSTYVFYDKLYKQAMTFVSPVFNVLQGWVPRGGQSHLHRRMRIALLAGIWGGALCLAATVLAGWWIVELLSSGEVAADGWSLLLLGLMIGLTTVDLVVSRVGLVVHRRVQSLAFASAAGLVFGLGLVAALAPTFGTNGALAGTVAGIAVRLGVASWMFWRR